MAGRLFSNLLTGLLVFVGCLGIAVLVIGAALLLLTLLGV